MNLIIRIKEILKLFLITNNLELNMTTIINKLIIDKKRHSLEDRIVTKIIVNDVRKYNTNVIQNIFQTTLN